MKIYNSGFYEVTRVRQTMPLFRFNGEVNLSDWQKRARERLVGLLGVPLMRGKNSLNIEYKKEHGDFTEYRLEVETEPEYYAQCYLLMPKGNGERRGVCLCFGGHGSNMHITAGLPQNDINRLGGALGCNKDREILKENPELNMAAYALRSGRSVLIIESRAFGEAGDDEPSCTENAKAALLMGRTLMGERVHDAICVLDALLECFDIDEGDIIATGYSGGGSLAFYLACVDERIALCALSSSFCSYEKSIAYIPHCLCNHIPGIRRDFEMGDLAGLIYPRRLILAAGESDPIFPFDGVIDSYKLACSQYSDYENEWCKLVSSPMGHLYYGDLLWREINKL